MYGDFTCEMCGGVFEKEVPEEVVMAEYHALFGTDAPEDDLAVICDDCFNKIHPDRN